MMVVVPSDAQIIPVIVDGAVRHWFVNLLPVCGADRRYPTPGAATGCALSPHPESHPDPFVRPFHAGHIGTSAGENHVG